MKVCAIQQPYPYTVEEAAAAVDFVISELNSCDSSLDLILTPEYTNCPTSFPAGESLPFAQKYAADLENAAVSAAKRCNAIVALSYCAPTPYGWRNTTRVFDRSGKAVGDYYKLQLTEREPVARQVEDSYRWHFNAPTIVEVDGLRLGFVTCYDAYFNEYIEFLGYRQPDIVLVASHQRAEPCGNLRLLNQMLAYYTGAFVVRASVGMGENAEVGGTSLIIDPAGTILADAHQQNGKLVFDIGDAHRKYCRSDSFGGKMISNRYFVEKGRTPWNYRPCGPFVVRGNKDMPYPRICAKVNTAAPLLMAEIGSAVALDVEEIALDLSITADGVAVVSAPGISVSEVVAGKSFAEIEALYSGKVVKFADVLRKFTRHCIFDLRVRFNEKLPCLIKNTVELLEIFDCTGHAFFSGDSAAQKLCRQNAPQVARSLIVGDSDDLPSVLEAVRQYDCSSVLLTPAMLRGDLVGKLHEEKVACRYEIDLTAETAEEIFAKNIDTVLTGDIVLAKKNAFKTN